MSELIDGMRRTLDQFRLKKRVAYFPGSILLGGKLARPEPRIAPPPLTKRMKHLRRYKRWGYTRWDKGYHIPSIRPYYGYVYFIQDKTPRGLIKIGFSARLDARLHDLDLQIKSGFIFLGAMRGLPIDEKVVHKMFWQFREVNNSNRFYTEWFYPVKPILFFIKYFCEMPKIEV